MIQDFYIFFFANITASYVNRRKEKKRQQKQTRGKNGVQDHFNPIFCFNFLGILNISHSKCTQKGDSKQNTHSKHKRIMWFWRKKDEGVWIWRERSPIREQCAWHSSFGLKSRMLEGGGQEVSLFIGAPRMEGAFPFIGECRCTLREGAYGTK